MKGKWPGHGGPKGATPISQVPYPSPPHSAAVVLCLWTCLLRGDRLRAGIRKPHRSCIRHIVLHARGSRTGAA